MSSLCATLDIVNLDQACVVMRIKSHVDDDDDVDDRARVVVLVDCIVTSDET